MFCATAVGFVLVEPFVVVISRVFFRFSRLMASQGLDALRSFRQCFETKCVAFLFDMWVWDPFVTCTTPRTNGEQLAGVGCVGTS